MNKPLTQTILILAALLLASAPVVDASASQDASASHHGDSDLALVDGAGLWFVQDEEDRGVLRSRPGLNSEMELVALPGDDRSVVWIEAQSNDHGDTGLHVGGGQGGYPGSISLYVDSTARVVITSQGLKLHESALLFNNKDHYLARCGDDLCWHSPSGVVNLTASSTEEHQH